MDNIIIGTDFSGIGSPEEALKRLKVKYRLAFACDKDKYAKASFLANHEPEIFYDDITTRNNKEAPKTDIYAFGFPCQAFSIAGKQKGFEDTRGTLFFNSLQYIAEKRPRTFIAENVKGLLSHDRGKTFRTIIDCLAETENGQRNIYPKLDCVGYHVFYQVHNTKNYGIPQNRERIFIIGFRDESDALKFRQPQGFPLKLKLKDLLQDNPEFILRWQNSTAGIVMDDIAPCLRASGGTDIIKRAYVGIPQQLAYEVPEKYYLSDEMLKGLISKNKGNQIGFVNQDTQASKVSKVDIVFDTLCAGTHGYANGYIAVNEATKQGYAIAEPGDSINLSVPTSTTRRGRVGKNIANTLDTQCNQAVVVNDPGSYDLPEFTLIEHRGHINKEPRIIKNGIVPTLRAEVHGHETKVFYGMRIRRLTPRECFRLQGYSDQFFDNCASVNSDTQLYKQAGNSITVDTIMHLLIQILTALNIPFTSDHN